MKEYTVYKLHYAVEEGKLVVNIFGRDRNGERVHQKLLGTQPYFFTDVKPQWQELMTDIKETEVVSIDNQKLWRIEVKYPFHVPPVRNNIVLTFEADITYDNRMRYDHGIRHTIATPNKDSIKPKDIKPLNEAEPVMPVIAVLDIETDDRQGIPNAKYPTAEVISWVVYDSQKDRYVAFISKSVDAKLLLDKYKREGKEVIIKSVVDEYRLFLAMKLYFKRCPPDVLTGWYVDKFDVAYLKGRAENLSYPCPDFDELALVDGKAAYDKISETQLVSGTLEYVAQEELGEGKLEREGTWEMYEKNPVKLLEYNIKDVELTWRILEKKNVINHFAGLAHISGGDIEQFRYNSHFVESFIFHEINGVVALPSKYTLTYKGIDKGGFVHTPYYGIYTPVFCVDLKTAYPGALVSLNMSPETLIPEEDYDKYDEYFEAPSGRRYRKDIVGLIPNLVIKINSSRDEIKALEKAAEFGSPEQLARYWQQSHYKTVANTFFGTLGSPNFRLTAGGVASDITGVTRENDIWLIDRLKEKGCQVIYADTDSVFFIIPEYNETTPKEVVIERGIEIAKELDDTLDDFAVQFGCEKGKHTFKVELDRIYAPFFMWGKKKRYCGITLWKGKDVSSSPVKDRLKIVGAEARRSNSSIFTREVQKLLFEIALQKGEEAVRKFILDILEQMKSGELGRELGVPIGLNKKADGNSQHMKAVRYSNKYLGKKFKKGDKPWIYFVKGVKGKPATEVVALEWDDEPKDFGLILDEKKNLERHITKPLSDILKALGISFGEIVHGKKQQGGDDYWSRL